MSAIMPPPLPDPPLARRAYVAPPPLRRPPPPPPPGDAWSPSVPVPRPVGAITCLCLYLSLPLTVLFTSLFLFKQYRSGAAFRFEGHHGLIKYFDLFVLTCTVGVTLLATGITLLTMARRLGPRVRRRAWAGVAASAAVAVLGTGAAEPVFQRAKSAAYARVDPARLTADCFAAAAAGPSTPAPAATEFAVWEADPRFPAYARALGAKKIRVRPSGVYVTMASDLNGIREEGYYVPRKPLESEPTMFAARQGNLAVVSARPPVFRFASP